LTLCMRPSLMGHQLLRPAAGAEVTGLSDAGQQQQQQPQDVEQEEQCGNEAADYAATEPRSSEQRLGTAVPAWRPCRSCVCCREPESVMRAVWIDGGCGVCCA
jgi:hypothetical protein